MKIVIDTNVIISGIFFGGTPRKIIEMIDNPFIQAFASQKIINEYTETIYRISKNKNQNISKSAIEKLCSLININNPTSNFNYCRDKKDNMFLDCSIYNKADYLITGDKDLLVLEEINNTKIITPAHFLKIILVS